jgi:hypothetical protein
VRFRVVVFKEGYLGIYPICRRVVYNEKDKPKEVRK